MSVTRRGAVQKRANRVNGLAVAADDAADVALAQLHFKNRHLSVRKFREDHIVGKLNQLADDELEKFFHGGQKLSTNPPSHKATAWQVDTNFLG